MRWDCRSCELSDDLMQRQNFQKHLSCFGVRNASDFVQRLLPQGKWTRCSECSRERKGHLGAEHGHLGGNKNNDINKERSLASYQACETCARCKRLLTRADFWPEDWKHRSQHPESLACRECRPTPRSERKGGYADKNERASQKAANTPITCKVCKRSLPRTQFRPTTGGKYQISKGLTCEQCRAEGKLPKPGRKRPQQNQ